MWTNAFARNDHQRNTQTSISALEEGNEMMMMSSEVLWCSPVCLSGFKIFLITKCPQNVKKKNPENVLLCGLQQLHERADKCLI